MSDDRGRKLPVGTQKYWDSIGKTVIKTHDNGIFDSVRPCWIPLPTISQDFTAKFRELDSISNSILSYKEPIEGDLWLKKVLEQFKTSSGKNFPPDSFTKYSRYGGRKSYSFTSYLTLLLVNDKVELNAKIAEALEEANEEKRQSLMNSEEGKDKYLDEKSVHLTEEEIKEITKRIREDYKFNEDDRLTKQDLEELSKKIEDIYKFLKQGEELDGVGNPDYNFYQEAKKIFSELTGEYQKINLIQQKVNDTVESVYSHFQDNLGIRETFRKKCFKLLDDYYRKHMSRIIDDEKENFKNITGVDLFETDEHKFYSAVNQLIPDENSFDLNNYIGKKVPSYNNRYEEVTLVSIINGEAIVKNINDEDLTWSYHSNSAQALSKVLRKKEVRVDLTPLLKLRFEELYNKSLDGDWTSNSYTPLYTIEQLIKKLPAGHFLTNQSLRKIEKEGYFSGDNSYAHFDPEKQSIYLSDKLTSISDWYGNLEDVHEFSSVMVHEIGHAISDKLRGRKSRLYKDFVVECGWTWEQFPNKGDDDAYKATGNDSDIERFGTNSSIKLITDYSHKSPEEAFAEYYSFYTLNKRSIDKYLDTGNLDSNKSNFTTQKNKKSFRELAPEIHQNLDIVKYEAIDNILKNSERFSSSISTHELSPIKDTLINAQESSLPIGPFSRTIRDNRGQQISKPIFTVIDSVGRHSIVPQKRIVSRKDKETKEYVHEEKLMSDTNEAYLHYSNKHLRRLTPTYSISKDAYDTLINNGLEPEHIRQYVFDNCANTEVGTSDSIVVNKGLGYRSRIVSEERVKGSKNILKKMREIYHSSDLEKALSDLVSNTEDNLIEKSEDEKLSLFPALLDNLKKLLGLKKKKVEEQKSVQEYCDSIVFNSIGQFLILQRTKIDDFMPGLWALPGGKLEAGESIEIGALRELCEETNLVVNPFDSNGFLDSIKNDDESISHYFKYDLINKEDALNIVLDYNEHQDYRWIYLHEIDNFDFIFDLSDRIKKLINIDVDNEVDYSHFELEGFEVIDADTYLDTLLDDGLVSDERYLMLKARIVGDPSEGGKLVQVKRTDKMGKQVTKWVKREEVNDEKSVEHQNQNENKKKKFSKKSLSEFAKKTSESNLYATIKNSDDAQLRQIAHQELERRKQEEHVKQKDDNKSNKIVKS